MSDVRELVRGVMDDEMSHYVPGVNCMTCGRFIGRDGYIEIETFEMSTEVASVSGECARCNRATIEAEHERLQAELERERDAWNAAHPVGTPVLYWPGWREGHGRQSVTRTPAWVIPSGSVLVSVEGYAGGIALTHVDPIERLP